MWKKASNNIRYVHPCDDLLDLGLDIAKIATDASELIRHYNALLRPS